MEAHDNSEDRAIFSVKELVGFFKSKILSFIECKTAAVYHACDTHLDRIDAVHRMFLREVELNNQAAMFEFNMAPLSSRRDMAMLGLVHRTQLRLGPPQFEQFSRRQISQQRATGPALLFEGTHASCVMYDMPVS